MVHGTPDWQDLHPKTQTYALSDMAELAARLDAPNKWERRGDVVWLNAFESGAKALYATIIGVDSEWLISSDSPYQGKACLKLVSGNTSGDQCTAHYQFPVPVLGKWGYQYWVSLHDNLWLLNAVMLHSNGTAYYEAMLRYNNDTQELAVQDDDLGWVIIDDTLSLLVHDQTYHIFKIIGNFEDHTYHRAIVNDRVYDLTEYNMVETVQATDRRVSMRIETWNLDGVTSTVKVDNLIYTINEPG